jgi:tetratricopeptide (TPR) repeat protein
MTGFNPHLVQAAELLRAGQLPQAEAACRGMLQQAPQNAPAMHLLGLIRNAAGDVANAEHLIRASIDLEPQQAEFRVNLAKVLRRTRRLEEAEQAYRAALVIDPVNRPARLGLVHILTEKGQHTAAEAQCRTLVDAASEDAEAWAALAGTLGNQFRLVEAEAAYRKAIGAGPQHAPAHHNLGAILTQMERAEEALAALTHAESLGLKGPQLYMNKGRALAQLCRLNEAEDAFLAAVKLDPRNLNAQSLLAQHRFMRGDPRFARDLIGTATATPGDLNIRMLLADLLRRAGDLAGAEQLMRDALRQVPSPRIRAALASTLHEAGKLKEAEMEALEAAAAAPRDMLAIESLVAVQLSLGRHEEALPFIRVQRARQPHDQRWIAYEATAARLAGDSLYGDLYDYERVVKLFEPEPPPGWSSMQELNAALVQVLATRHPFTAHPLDQSLRNGSQCARSLLADPDPVIQAVLKAFAGPLESYCYSIGNDPRHPLSARNTGNGVLTTCWSIQLRRDGFHLNHVHAEGWISSAYYVSVPEEADDTTLMSGWLKFGEPRLSVPGAKPERVVQPKAGQLALFPSYMWHGTNPIHGPVPRLAIAFDALPVTRVLR